MTISKKAVYGGHREQVLQDLASNIDILRGFIADQKAKLLASAVDFQFTADGAEPEIIDMVVAENAAASIHQLVIAEINGGYRYAEVVRDDEDEPALPNSFSNRSLIFACGQPTDRDGERREFEVYVQDLHDPTIRYLTLATGVGTGNERHIVLHSDNLKDFLQAIAELQATPFTRRADDDEDAEDTYEDLIAKRDALVAQSSARKAKRARKARRAA